jgi:hypothetical protein
VIDLETLKAAAVGIITSEDWRKVMKPYLLQHIQIHAKEPAVQAGMYGILAEIELCAVRERPLAAERPPMFPRRGLTRAMSDE